jgi:hypothetical protein
MPNHPLSEMEWDSLTDHGVLNDSDLLTGVAYFSAAMRTTWI